MTSPGAYPLGFDFPSQRIKLARIGCIRRCRRGLQPGIADLAVAKPRQTITDRLT